MIIFPKEEKYIQLIGVQGVGENNLEIKISCKATCYNQIVDMHWKTKKMVTCNMDKQLEHGNLLLKHIIDIL